MSSKITLTAAMKSTLLSIQRQENIIETTTRKLATGRSVSSALDNPQNFFAALGLSDRATSLSYRIDGMQQSLRTVEEAIHGLEALEKLIDQAEAVAITSQTFAKIGETDPALEELTINSSPPPLRAQILSASPVVYYPLDDVAGPTATDLGTGGGVSATYNGGVSFGAAPLYDNGGYNSIDLDGVNDRVDIADSALINLGSYAERTIELVFNADDVTTRQTLYEEGGPVNGLNMYVYNGSVHVTGTDQGAWGRNSGAGPNNINAPIVAGQTYHLTLRFDQPNNRFEGFLDGVSIGSVPVANAIFPSHSNNIAIGRTREAAHFDDILVSGNGNYFNGRISDVAIYNSALSDQAIASHANALNATTSTRLINPDYENIMDQINQIVLDAQYRGINLLAGDTLTTLFSENGKSRLITEGDDFYRTGLGLTLDNFDTLDDINQILDDLKLARRQVRQFTDTLVNDFAIIDIRKDFTRDTINTLEAGADDLTLADQNEEGARMLALQTQQSLALTALSLSVQSARSILQLLG